MYQDVNLKMYRIKAVTSWMREIASRQVAYNLKWPEGNLNLKQPDFREKMSKSDAEIEKVSKERDNAIAEVARISSQYHDLQMRMRSL